MQNRAADDEADLAVTEIGLLRYEDETRDRQVDDNRNG